jgi:hypothetical protein
MKESAKNSRLRKKVYISLLEKKVLIIPKQTLGSRALVLDRVLLTGDSLEDDFCKEDTPN